MKRIVLAAISALLLAACSAEPPAPDRRDRSMPKQDTPTTPAYAASGLTAKPLPELAEALKAGDISAEALTLAYIERIQAVDQSGPTLQAVLSLNPDAMAQARALDAKLMAGEPVGLLHGVPILVKDNIETRDQMPTTAGSLALESNFSERDAPLIAALRAEGAIILGKTNLSEWANFRSNTSMSGWSALGGQVRNPHMLDRNPCGSSSGSGVAAAASLAAGTIGTETNGSIICPSTVNGVVGFKPTVGLVSQEYIVPISSSQDTAGPITKTVEGAALMLTAMATGEAKTDYVAALDMQALQGRRIGVLRDAEGDNPHIRALFEDALSEMEKSGATLVDIKGPDMPGEFWSKSYTVLLYEFKATLNAYLATTPNTVTHRTLKDIIAFNTENAVTELALFDQSIFEAAEAKGGLASEDYIAARDFVQSATRENGIDRMLVENNVDALVAPSGPFAPRVDPVNGDVWPDWPGAGSMAAVAGYPHLTVPMGTYRGMPVGISFIGGKDQDAKILSLGYAYEQLSQKRPEPQYYQTAEDLPEISTAMNRH
ncbi:amidase [Hyphomonas pacifica]|nr:amidase [Hyphomonas pacifica]